MAYGLTGVLASIVVGGTGKQVGAGRGTSGEAGNAPTTANSKMYPPLVTCRRLAEAVACRGLLTASEAVAFV